MNAGIEILLKRMDSHPEEFSGLDNRIQSLTPGVTSTRWRWIIEAAMQGKFLTDEEKTMLHDKLSSLQGDAFSSLVMQELMKEPTPASLLASDSLYAATLAMEKARVQGLVNSTLAEEVRVDYSAQQDATAIERMALSIAKMKSDVVARVLGK